MSWGRELWDQFEHILMHVQKGIELCEKISHFTKERCSIEVEYAAKLKKLVKSHLPKKKEDNELTTSQGFLAMIKEVFDIAGQHETISESLMLSVFNESQNLVQELKLERKKATQDGSKHQSALQVQFAQLEKHVQTMDERRIAKVKQFISKTAETEKSSIPIINHCIDGFVQAASIVDYEKEMQLVIEMYKSGFSVPSDVPFEDISSSSHNKSTTNLHGTLSGTLSGKKDKKRPGLLGILGGLKDDVAPKDDCSHLPPIQQKRQLNAKIDALKANLAKQTSERDALLKMHDVYQCNTSLGDPVAVAKQLGDKSQKLHQLEQEVKKYEDYMTEATARLAAESGTTTNANHSSHSESVTERIQKTSNQTSSTPIKGRGKPPTPTKPTSAKIFDSTTPSRVNLTPIFPSGPSSPPTPQRDSFDNASDDEFMDGGSCIALYDFNGSTDGSVAMRAGEEFTIVTRDEGDGWIHVQSADGRRGYVPATYVKYND